MAQQFPECVVRLFFPAPDPDSPLRRYRVLSPLCPIRVSPIHMGTMSLGRAWDPHYGGLTQDEAFKVLDAYVDAGGNVIDTANHYTDEQSETIVGEWLQARGVRDRVVLCTKFGFDYKAHEYGKNQVVNYGGSTKLALRLSVRDSLAKLKTDWIDILYLHAWDYTAGIEEIMDALHILVQQGKVLYLGVSNSSAWFVSAANAYAKAHGKTQFSVYQGIYNVSQRDLELDIIPMAQYLGIGVTAYTVMGSGKFKTKAVAEEREKSGQEPYRLLQPPSLLEVQAAAALEKVAVELGASSEAIALAWSMAKYTYTYPTLGMKSPKHVAEAVEALKIRLSPEQIRTLDEASPPPKLYPTSMVCNPAESGQLFSILAAASKVDIVERQKPIGYEK